MIYADRCTRCLFLSRSKGFELPNAEVDTGGLAEKKVEIQSTHQYAKQIQFQYSAQKIQ